MRDDTTVAKSVAAGIGFDVNSMLEHLKAVPDPRQARGKRYALSFLLGIIILAKPAAVAQWVKMRQSVLVKAFNCRREDVPALNTIRRALADDRVASALPVVLNRFLQEMYGGQQSQQVTLDGKTRL